MKLFKTLSIICLIFVTQNVMSKNYLLYSTERENSKGILVKKVMEIPENKLAEQPKINLFKQDVPFLPGQAVKAAHKKFQDLYNRDPLGIFAVTLKVMSVPRSEFDDIVYYDVRFYDRDSSNFVVLMDGSVYFETNLSD